jgi:xylan 1,4-beta-xylosidase
MKTIHVLILFSMAILGSCKVEEIKETPKEIFFADPTIYVENGKYYLTGTKNTKPLGFAMLESDNLINWKAPGEDSLCMILKRSDSYAGEKGFWAPQILKEDNKYYLTYTSNEHTCLAIGESLLGPYVLPNKEPIDTTEKNIDSFIFKDDDGKYYLYHVRFNKGNYLWVAEFNFQTGKIDPLTLTKCFDQTEAWEATSNYISNPIMEGPTVLKMKGKYYLFYSANHFMNIDYAVGYATSDSPYGPWEKYGGNPILHRSIVGENGSGHGDIFKGKDNSLYYVYHVHNSDTIVSPRRTRIAPLKMEWNDELGIYDFSIDNKKLIVPTKE